MEGHQLIAILVGNAEALRGILLADQTDEAVIHAGAFQMLAIRFEVLTHHAHDDGGFAEQTQAVGDIAGHAAKLPAHGGRQEGGGNLVQLIRQDLAVEPAVKREQGIVCERPADEDRHAHSAKGQSTILT